MGCPLVILACNTASAKALRTIQQQDLPGIAPDKRVLGVIRPTAEVIGTYSRTNSVGVLGTKGTVNSGSYEIEINKFFPGIKVHQLACPDEGGRHRHGVEDQDRQRDLRQHHPGPRLRQVRRRRVVVHRHQGAREDRRLRRPTSQPATSFYAKTSGGRDDQHDSTTSAATRSPSRRARPSRPTRTRRARSARPPASRRSPCSRSPTRTAPTWRSSSGRAQRRHGRLARRPTTRSRSRTASSSSSASRYGNAPYGIAIPKNSGLAKPMLAALKALMANGQYKAILTQWGVAGRRDPASRSRSTARSADTRPQLGENSAQR